MMSYYFETKLKQQGMTSYYFEIKTKGPTNSTNFMRDRPYMERVPQVNLKDVFVSMSLQYLDLKQHLTVNIIFP